MRFAYIADIHLSRYSQDKIEDQTNLPERLNSIKNTLYEVGDYCLQNSIRNIFIGGDILHGKSVIYAIAQDIMIQFFEDYVHSGIYFHVIDGNHDLSGKGNEVVSALRPLSNIDGVKWVKFSEIYRLSPPEDILFVPYSNNLPKIIKNNKARILVSHFGLNEGILNSGISIISEVSMKDLEGKYDLVLLGHYHKPQEIVQNGVRVLYVGSLIELDWGEKNDQKRFLVVDTDTLNVDSIPITQYRKHVQVEVTSENKDEAIEIVKAAQQAGDHVKVVMKEKVDLSVLENVNIIDKTDRDITNRGITSNMSTEDKLRKYLEIKEISPEYYDMYMKVAMEVIQKGDESVG